MDSRQGVLLLCTENLYTLDDYVIIPDQETDDSIFGFIRTKKVSDVCLNNTLQKQSVHTIGKDYCAAVNYRRCWLRKRIWYAV
jgi:hypothetical protein